MLGAFRIEELVVRHFEALQHAFLAAPINREYPATSAARIAARRRVEAMAAASHPAPDIIGCDSTSQIRRAICGSRQDSIVRSWGTLCLRHSGFAQAGEG